MFGARSTTQSRILISQDCVIHLQPRILRLEITDSACIVRTCRWHWRTAAIFFLDSCSNSSCDALLLRGWTSRRWIYLPKTSTVEWRRKWAMESSGVPSSRTRSMPSLSPSRSLAIISIMRAIRRCHRAQKRQEATASADGSQYDFLQKTGSSQERPRRFFCNFC